MSFAREVVKPRPKEVMGTRRRYLHRDPIWEARRFQWCLVSNAAVQGPLHMGLESRRRHYRTSSRSARRRGVDPPTRLARFTRDLRVTAAGGADEANQRLSWPAVIVSACGWIGMLRACSSSLRRTLLGD